MVVQMKTNWKFNAKWATPQIRPKEREQYFAETLALFMALSDEDLVQVSDDNIVRIYEMEELAADLNIKKWPKSPRLPKGSRNREAFEIYMVQQKLYIKELEIFISRKQQKRMTQTL